ncbi:hypothetical protein Pyn_19699 [Prunus yedoensis var. nudiflora]|uniref:Uncharacterized protein n=1 Tax=Prunus yedoensis var. nudiflora TaxID=2094558 RepID=A0A314ZEJ6_PRUYE|nr:hypothetical protein Pyn_19699 [Prunus yedoensis var. nudiflora]
MWRIDRALVTGPSGSTTEEGRAEEIIVLALEVLEAVDNPLSVLTPTSSCPIVEEKDSVLEVFQEKPQMEDVSKEKARSIVDNWMLAPLNMRTGEDAPRNVSPALQVLGQFYPRLRTVLEKATASLDSLLGRHLPHSGRFNSNLIKRRRLKSKDYFGQKMSKKIWLGWIAGSAIQKPGSIILQEKYPTTTRY